MNLIFLGPQASGKGTQAKMLVEKYGFQYLETGKILRRLIAEGGELGKKLDEILNKKGTLVPDSVMVQVIKQEMAEADLSRGVIFDGYPRSLDQYETLKTIFNDFGIGLDRVVYVFLPREESLRRLSSRRICSNCQKEYNLATRPPIRNSLCDQCGQELITRADDNPDTIQNRLRIFDTQTQPIVNRAREEGLLHEIDGNRPVDEIHRDIVARLGLSPSFPK